MKTPHDYATARDLSYSTVTRRLRSGQVTGRKVGRRWNVLDSPDPRLAMLRSMPYEDYEREPGVRWSHLKEMRTSPLHYLVRTQTPRDDTTSMVGGRAAHAATFEPDLFEAEYVVFDGPKRQGKAWEEFAVEHARQTILRPAERVTALRIAEAVRAHGPAAEILAEGSAEQVVTWTDLETGIGCKARLDWVTPPNVGILADLKTGADISDHGFGRAAGRYCYHGQLADHVGGLEVATGIAYQPVIIAVENGDVRDVRVVDVTGAELTAGQELVRALLDRLAECIRTDSWPGQFPERSKLQLPPWELFEGDNDLTDLGIAFEVRGGTHD